MNDMRRHKTFWNIYTPSYDLIWNSPVTASLSSRIQTRFEKATRVVDLGCGTGLFSHPFTTGGAHTVGVDTSHSMLRRASDMGRVVETHLADATETGLPASSFDVVICSNLVHLHPSTSSLAAEAYRLVKPGGYAIWTFPAPGLNQARALALDIQANRKWSQVAGAHVARMLIGPLAILLNVKRFSSLVTWQSLRAGLLKSGFSIEEIITIGGVQTTVITHRVEDLHTDISTLGV